MINVLKRKSGIVPDHASSGVGNIRFKCASSLLILLCTAQCAQADFSLELDPAIALRVKKPYFDPTTHSLASEWKILRTGWSTTDEQWFSDFISAIGRSTCSTTDHCIKSAANPYRLTDPPGIRFYSDCADLPYVLRAYFAWKNGLPFGYVSQISLMPGTVIPTDPALPPLDLRYSPIGNRVQARRMLTTRRLAKTGEIRRNSGPSTLRDLTNSVSSAIFRIGPVNERTNLSSDFYSPKLERNSIRPGTVIYDPAGHVAIIYAVEPDGRILYLDAHPDNSITRGSFGRKFVRSRPGQGAGFKNCRPVQLVGATQELAGEWVGGRIVPSNDASIREFSTTQFYGTNPGPNADWKQARFVWLGINYHFYDYLRHALSTTTLRYNPLNELALMVRGLCTDLNDRAVSVELAISQGIHRKSHPVRLPLNIYGAQGEWENYSTPSRDARLKTSYRETLERVQEFVRLYDARDPSLDYTGSNLREDLRQIWERESTACQVFYRTSLGVTVTLSVQEVGRRLYDISFDPYDCIERRWGAMNRSELAGCTNSAEKDAWYRALRKLRNQSERTYDLRMDYTRTELESPTNPLGLESGADVDVLGFLMN